MMAVKTTGMSLSGGAAAFATFALAALCAFGDNPPPCNPQPVVKPVKVVRREIKVAIIGEERMFKPKDLKWNVQEVIYYWYEAMDREIGNKPDLVLLDLGLGGSTTVGVEICRHTKEAYPAVKVLIFTGEILNEKLWVDVLDEGCDGICLKSGELLTRGDVASVMSGKKMVFPLGPVISRPFFSLFQVQVDSSMSSTMAEPLGSSSPKVSTASSKV